MGIRPAVHVGHVQCSMMLLASASRFVDPEASAEAVDSLSAKMEVAALLLLELLF